MAHQIFVGLLAEGSTDHRFLSSIIQRTFHELAFSGKTTMEISEVRIIPKIQSTSFVDQVCDAAIKGHEEYGLTVLCIHADADGATSQNTFDNKIDPALKALGLLQQAHIEHLIPIVPIQMSEAWMLADLLLLLEQIGTNLSPNDLKLNRNPESYHDPKAAISEAIIQARSGMTRRRRSELRISDLYDIMGQTIGIDALRKLPSFLRFEAEVTAFFQAQNLL
jgi:Domain of unknown function (DUF4276)